MASTEQPGPSSDSANFLRSARLRPPLESSPSSSGGLKYLIVGYPRTPYFSHSDLPSAVQSTSPMTTVLESLYSAPRASQSGFIFLQCPHQGARNLMNADFPDFATTSSQFFSVSSTAEPEAPARRPTRARLRSITTRRIS